MSATPVVHIIDHMGLGGAQRLLVDLAVRQRRQGRPVSVVVLRGSTPLCAELAAAAVDVRCLGLARWDPRQLPTLLRTLRELRPSLAHLHLIGAQTLGRAAAVLAAVPAIVVHDHESSAEIYSHPGPLLALRRLCEPAAPPRRIVYLVLTDDAASYAATVRRWPSERISVLPNGIDLAHLEAYTLDKGAARRLLRLPERASLVVSAGRLHPVKGLDLLLEALALLPPEAQLAIAGAGPENAALQARAARPDLAGRVHFLGQLGDIRPLMYAGDIYVQPSRREPFGLAAAEASACGLPVVASAVGGLHQIVRDEITGLLVPPEQPAALAAALARLLDDPALARRLGAAGRAYVRRTFDIEAVVERLDAIYAELGAPAYSGVPYPSGAADD